MAVIHIAVVPVVVFQQNCSLLIAEQTRRTAVVQLCPLGDDVARWPGHGAVPTFGDERRNNPYVRDAALAER